MGEPSVKKSVCERYDVRSGKGHDWAVIMVDERGGVLQILSDYGEWSHAWPHHGRKSFKHFLVELGRDTYYLMNKLHGTPDAFQEEKTKVEFRKRILELRRDSTLTKDEARDAWQLIEDADWQSSESVWHTVSDNYKEFEQICPDVELPIVCDWPADLLAFVQRLWPIFVDAIRKEIEEEAHVAVA